MGSRNDGSSGRTRRVLARTATGVSLVEQGIPVLGPQEVLVLMTTAGICRTDLAVVQGRIPAALGRILGHEGTGRVVETSDAGREWLGKVVTFRPAIPCASCTEVDAETGVICTHVSRIGIELDGVFATHVAIPIASLVNVPPELDRFRAAFLEPLAATLGIANASPPREERGVIVGAGRIAELTAIVLRALGFDVVIDASPEENSYGWGIDGNLAPRTLETLMRAVRPRGLVVLKSRGVDEVSIPLALCQAKELTLRPVGWGAFDRAQPQEAGRPNSTAQPQQAGRPNSTAQPQQAGRVESTAQPQEAGRVESTAQPQEAGRVESTALDLALRAELPLEALFGTRFSLADFDSAFAAAADTAEPRKIFFDLEGTSQRLLDLAERQGGT